MLRQLVKSTARVASRAAAARRAFAVSIDASAGVPPQEEDESKLVHTSLYDDHVALEGKMVPFAGYALPVSYGGGSSVIKEHNAVRQAAGVFDVGHMGQIRIHGDSTEAIAQTLETMMPSDIQRLKPNNGRLTCLTTASGGMVDDCLITRRDSDFFLVVNGATKHKDMEHITQLLEASGAGSVQFDWLERDLIAVQGPDAFDVIRHVLPNGQDIPEDSPFMSHVQLSEDLWVSRCGYTGEDGVEISVAPEKASSVFNALLDSGKVAPCGLASRDSLRLEAGLCLYGHDMSEDTSFVEAGLSWLCTPKRRKAANFPGANVSLEHFKAYKSGELDRLRVGLSATKRGPPAREGSLVYANGEHVGVLCSGTFSPTLKSNIAMAYVPQSVADIGTEVEVEVRGKKYPFEVAAMPFVPNNYYRGK